MVDNTSESKKTTAAAAAADQRGLAWKNVWAAKITVPATLEPQLHDLVAGAMNNGYGWLTLSGSFATCMSVAKWARGQGLASYIAAAKESAAAADVVLEEMPARHTIIVKIAWMTMS